MTSLRTSPLRGRAARIAVCIPCGIRHGYGTRGISHPQPGRRLRAPPNNPTAANGPGGRWVYSPSLRSRAVRLPPTPCRVCFRPCVFNKFSHFWQKKKKCLRRIVSPKIYDSEGARVLQNLLTQATGDVARAPLWRPALTTGLRTRRRSSLRNASGGAARSLSRTLCFGRDCCARRARTR